MIAVTMRPPERERTTWPYPDAITFEEPHWSAAKPPFDPLQAGWVPCEWCRAVGVRGTRTCQDCDGLGIVVGPPADGFRVLGFLQERSLFSPEVQQILTMTVFRALHDKEGRTP
jgi:hypothetical protein